jgi:hypothetical protein
LLGLAKTKYFLTCKDNKNNLFIATFLKKIIKKIYTSLYIRQKSFRRTTLQKMLENHKKTGLQRGLAQPDFGVAEHTRKAQKDPAILSPQS